MAEEREWNTVEGTVDSVIFRNEENGYTVFRLTTAQDEITAVGCIPEVAPGEGLTLSGRWMHHASYGEQFKAEVVERRLPVGSKAILEYLSSGVVTGIGMATARKLVAEFGEDTLNVLEESPEKLTRIRGITPKRAREMSDLFRARMGMRRLLETGISSGGRIGSSPESAATGRPSFCAKDVTTESRGTRFLVS